MQLTDELIELTHHLTVAGLTEMAHNTSIVLVNVVERVEFGRALILQGYAPDHAAHMAEEIQREIV